MFLKLRSPATRDFRPYLDERYSLDFPAFVLLLAPLAIEDCLAEAISLRIVANNQIQDTRQKNLNKNAAHIPPFHRNNCETRQMDSVKN